jgi:CRISPR system Cascade subunit CasD
MADFLVFQLYGPMAAWGDIAVGEYRPSFAHPSKSAIIGLLSAALGIRRDEEEHCKSLTDACLFAVRVDAMGTLLRDYHTAQVPSEKKGVARYTRYSELSVEDLNTILSSRDYRCDAAYTVAITFRDDCGNSLRILAERLNVQKFTLLVLAEKLNKPEFVLYLGRKSCPLALPLQPEVVKDKKNFKEALTNYSYSTDGLTGIVQSGQFGIYWEDGIESGYENEHVITRRDVPLSRKRWQFSERNENYASIKREG